MIDGTTLLFALPGFRVLNVTPEPDGGRLVLVENSAKEGGCPSCGVMSSRIKDRPLCRLKDLPYGSLPRRVWVCKRRFLCTEKLCARGSFTEVSDQIPARSRLTKRLRTKVGAAVTATNQAISEVGGEYGVAWWTVHRILVARAVQVLGQAAPTTMIGIDETRARSVRWFRKESGWARSDPWMTSIVAADRARARREVVWPAPGWCHPSREPVFELCRGSRQPAARPAQRRPLMAPTTTSLRWCIPRYGQAWRYCRPLAFSWW